MPNEIAHIAERFRAGEESALSELYDQHSDLVFSLILRIVRDEGEAEDVLQECWVEAWRRRTQYEPARGSFAAWIVVMARSRALDRVRRRDSRDLKLELAQLETAPVPSTDESLERDETSRQVREALDTLEPKRREAIELAFWDGLSHSKISDALDQPLGTVKSWVRSGLHEMKKTLPREEQS